MHKFLHDIDEDTSVFVVLDLGFSIDSSLDLEFLTTVSGNFDNLANRKFFSEVDIKLFLSSEAEAIGVFSLDIFEGKDAHSDQVRSMDSFVTLSDDSLYAEEKRTSKKMIN